MRIAPSLGVSSPFNLPLVRGSERIDKKRCEKKWYWRWRKGLFPKATKFGAVDLGTWVHGAFEWWYQPGLERRGNLAELFTSRANLDIRIAESNNVPQYVLDDAEELAMLGEAMMAAYEKHYEDEYVDVIEAEIGLDFIIADADGKPVASHRFKPDLLYRDKDRFIWLMEHKTAGQPNTDHLPIDDQARPYGAMAQLALRKAGVIGPKEEVRGIMYNFLRKALPDERPTDSKGRALNKNGAVSKRQPTINFTRHPVRLTNKAKAVTLRRLQRETIAITGMAQALREGRLDPALLDKTPSKSCPRFCQYFEMCKLEEEGGDIRPLERGMYVRRNPYDYEDSAEELTSFEMG